MKNNTYRVVLTGLFAALCCVATFIHIPAFATGGYVNLGDCFVIASGLLLGPLLGAAAGGIGSMLTDIFLGYAQYAPATLIIKALMAAFAAILYRSLTKHVFKDKKSIISMVIAAFAAEVIMVFGYLLYEAFILKFGAAAMASIPGNFFQAAAGIIASVPLSRMLERSKLIR